MPTALPVVSFLAQPIRAKPRPHPASSTRSLPERSSASTRRSRTRILPTRLDLSMTAAQASRSTANKAAPILHGTGMGLDPGHARSISAGNASKMPKTMYARTTRGASMPYFVRCLMRSNLPASAGAASRFPVSAGARCQFRPWERYELSLTLHTRIAMAQPRAARTLGKYRKKSVPEAIAPDRGRRCRSDYSHFGCGYLATSHVRAVSRAKARGRPPRRGEPRDRNSLVDQGISSGSYARWSLHQASCTKSSAWDGWATIVRA